MKTVEDEHRAELCPSPLDGEKNSQPSRHSVSLADPIPILSHFRPSNSIQSQNSSLLPRPTNGYLTLIVLADEGSDKVFYEDREQKQILLLASPKKYSSSLLNIQRMYVLILHYITGRAYHSFYMQVKHYFADPCIGNALYFVWDGKKLKRGTFNIVPCQCLRANLPERMYIVQANFFSLLLSNLCDVQYVDH